MFAQQVQHFVRAPDWTWYILFYFFFAGLSGGSYVIASLFRFRGAGMDEPVVRLGYIASFVALLPCPVMLILDLGTPLRFWHMMWNTTPGDPGLNFKWYSPMSMGVWALLIFGAFVTVSFLHALGWSFLRRLLDGFLGKLFVLVGTVFGLFIAGYTGVLLSVSNQPVWSDTWALGGLFLASGMSGSAALLLFLLGFRRGGDTAPLVISERLYAVLELALLVIFVVTLIPAGTLELALGFPWILLWVVALVGLVPGIGGLLTQRFAVGHSSVAVVSFVVPVLILAGVLALRAAVIFPIQ
jgi:polysulfide reductase chain C